MNCTDKGIGKLFTLNGQALRLLRIENIPTLVFKNLDTGKEERWPDGYLSPLVPEVPKRKYTKLAKEPVAGTEIPEQRLTPTTGVDNPHPEKTLSVGLPPDEKTTASISLPLGVAGEKPPGIITITSAPSLAVLSAKDVIDALALSTWTEEKARGYIRQEFKVSGGTLHRLLGRLSPSERVALKAEIGNESIQP